MKIIKLEAAVIASCMLLSNIGQLDAIAITYQDENGNQYSQKQTLNGNYTVEDQSGNQTYYQRTVAGNWNIQNATNQASSFNNYNSSSTSYNEALRNLQAKYHQLRPGTDYNTDSNYQAELANLKNVYTQQGVSQAAQPQQAQLQLMQAQYQAQQDSYKSQARAARTQLYTSLAINFVQALIQAAEQRKQEESFRNQQYEELKHLMSTYGLALRNVNIIVQIYNNNFYRSNFESYFTDRDFEEISNRLAESKILLKQVLPSEAQSIQYMYPLSQEISRLENIFKDIHDFQSLFMTSDGRVNKGDDPIRKERGARILNELGSAANNIVEFDQYIANQIRQTFGPIVGLDKVELEIQRTNQISNAEHFNEIPDKPVGFINDLASLYESTRKEKLEKKIADEIAKSAVKIYIVTFQSQQGESMDSLGERIRKKWNIYSDEKEKAILIVLTKDSYYFERSPLLSHVLSDDVLRGIAQNQKNNIKNNDGRLEYFADAFISALNGESAKA